MKKSKFYFILGFIAVCLLSNFAFGEEHEKPFEMTPELKKEYPIKSYHEKLSLDCLACHEGQGNDPKEFEDPDEEVCLSCHKSKEYLAQRLRFMDTLKANPHNSIHDGPTLYCDECHHSHKKSVNMCVECHQKEINENFWMGETP